MGKIEVKSEKGAKKADKKGDRLLFLKLGSGIILGNAIRTRARENIFSRWQGLTPETILFLTEKVACPLFSPLFLLFLYGVT